MDSWSFISHITNYLARPKLGDQKAPTQWPSEASYVFTNEYKEQQVVGKCRRSAFFRLLLDNYNFSADYNVYQHLVEDINSRKIPTDPYLRWIWKQGELYEEYCVQMAKESGVFIAGQTQVYVPELNLSGKIDLVVINPSTNKYQIVEVKSVYGFGANHVLGTPGERKKGFLGEPRESHLMQIGVYQWWYANVREEFGPALLTYGARDTGRFAEYEVTVEETEIDGVVKNYIYYKGNSPNKTKKKNSGITIEDMGLQYKAIANNVAAGTPPDRDFELRYSDERLEILLERGELSKKDSEQLIKRKQQISEGKTRLVKPVEKGDWQCRLCSYKDVCYNEDNSPRNI